MKKCLKCGSELPESSFSRDRSRTDGLHPYCNACRRYSWGRGRGAGRISSYSDRELLAELQRRGFPYVPPDHPAYMRLLAFIETEYPELVLPPTNPVT